MNTPTTSMQQIVSILFRELTSGGVSWLPGAMQLRESLGLKPSSLSAGIILFLLWTWSDKKISLNKAQRHIQEPQHHLQHALQACFSPREPLQPFSQFFSASQSRAHRSRCPSDGQKTELWVMTAVTDWASLNKSAKQALSASVSSSIKCINGLSYLTGLR